jgi:hypothetical protein
MSLETRLKKLEAQSQEALDDDAPHPAWVAHRQEVEKICEHFLDKLELPGFDENIVYDNLNEKQKTILWQYVEVVILNHATKGHPLRIPLAIVNFLIENAEVIEYVVPSDCPACGLTLPACSYNAEPVSSYGATCPECGEVLKIEGTERSFYWNHRGFNPNGLKSHLPTTYEACVENRETWLKKMQPGENELFFAQTVREQAKRIYASDPGYKSYPERMGIPRVGH